MSKKIIAYTLGLFTTIGLEFLIFDWTAVGYLGRRCIPVFIGTFIIGLAIGEKAWYYGFLFALIYQVLYLTIASWVLLNMTATLPEVPNIPYPIKFPTPTLWEIVPLDLLLIIYSLISGIMGGYSGGILRDRIK